MKYIFSLIILSLSMSAAGQDCVLEKQKDGQKLFLCQATGTQRPVRVLDLKGGFADTAYYHGFFLRKEIEEGVLQGVITKSRRAMEGLSTKERKQINLIKKCVLDNYKYSVSDEFKKGIHQLYLGMKDAGTTISWSEFQDANYMVEFSIFADAMTEQLEHDPKAAKWGVFASCAPYFIGDALLSPFKSISKALRSIKFGCTGIGASASSTNDGDLVHGRNFDTGLIGYYEKNQIVVINRQKNGMISAGISSAGLHYAGGISGINNKGLAVSLHELRNTEARMRYAKGQSDIAPYLLHHILLNAKSLDEAISILKVRKGFGTWTFFISDANTDETASIELVGDQVHVARRARQRYLGQSNHFIHPRTSKNSFDHSPNKSFETRARLTHVSNELERDFGRVDAQWVIDRLSGHEDAYVGLRSFGRTTTKVYTAGTHVMIPSRQEWWMSIGETYPTNRSHFVGFRLVNGPVPFEIVGVTKAQELPGKDSWYTSMNYFTKAYISNEADHSSLDGLDRTLGLLEKAQNLALSNDIKEFPYHFMSARIKVSKAALALKKGQRSIAESASTEALKELDDLARDTTLNLHEYELFQLSLWKFRAASLLKAPAVKAEQKVLAESQIMSLIAKYPWQKGLVAIRKTLSEKDQLKVILESDVSLPTIE